MRADPVLEVEDLRVAYLGDAGAQVVIDGVSFAVRRGEMFGLVGESGSGKSTVAHAILRLLRPPGVILGGEVRCLGVDVLGLDERALRRFRWRGASLVPQAAMAALNPVMRVGAQMADVLEVHEGFRRRAALVRAAQLLDEVRLGADVLERYPHELSGGMRQRVVIAMALALTPPLIIMDEPTTALDLVVQREIIEQIAELRRRLGFAVLFVSHDLPLVLEACDRVAVMQEGRIIESAGAAEIAVSPKEAYTRRLVASGEARVVRGGVGAGEAREAREVREVREVRP
jgi:ABC-type glutathione transport system ATPase component